MAVFFRGEREFPVFLADQQPDGRVSQKRETVIRVGVNAADAATADRAAFLIDGKSYFERLEEVLPRAKRTIWIVGWDFNPEIRLHPGSPLQLGELLRRCVDANPDLDVRILVWAMGPIYSGKTLRFFRRMPWSDHPRITLKFDLRHPLRACHHQKLVAIDDRIAFLGGMDLTARRWDEPSHDPVNAERVSPEGKPYGPVHDIQAMVEGEAARMVADIARQRWKRATGEAHSPTEDSDLAWPADFEAPLTACRTAVALTEPWTWSRKGRREAIRLTHDALMAARKTIYIETQYLASFGVARTLARRLRDPEGPEIIAIVTRSSHGFLEKIMMGNNRDRLIRRLKRADRYGRLRVLYPAIPRADGADQEIIIHSKLIIVGDRIYKPTSEPVWEIVEFHGGAFIKATNISAVKGTPSAESVFPAFFYDRAIEQLLASGVRRRSIDNGDAVSGKIEVVRPDLVFYRHDETPRFLGEAKYAFTEARRKMGEQIDSITAAQLEAYQAFSATIRDIADPHEIATRWRVLVDTVAETETFGHFCKSAHRSLEAWDRYVADVAAEQSLGLLA